MDSLNETSQEPESSRLFRALKPPVDAITSQELTAPFAILSQAPMRILFAISLVAFVALLWASISAAQHIRRARRRRNLAQVFDPAVINSNAPVSESWPAPAAAPPVASAALQQTSAEPRFPLSSQRIRTGESSATQPIATPVQPPPAPDQSNTPTATSPSVPPSTVSPPQPRPDWAYFNKDMGDLSDPTPSPRFKDRSRQR